MEPSFPERALAIRRAAARLCLRLGWAPLHEVPLPNGRRADILALRPDGCFACIEVKSGPRDFLTDLKWQDYRAFSDELFFAVDADFPQELLPAETGLIVAAGLEAELLREAPAHPLAGARRRALLHRFALLAAGRLATLRGSGRRGRSARRAAGGVTAPYLATDALPPALHPAGRDKPAMTVKAGVAAGSLSRACARPSRPSNGRAAVPPASRHRPSRAPARRPRPDPACSWRPSPAGPGAARRSAPRACPPRTR